jgi:hypothetical protein
MGAPGKAASSAVPGHRVAFRDAERAAANRDGHRNPALVNSPALTREAEALARVRRLKSDDAYWFRTCYRIKDKGEVLTGDVLEELYRQGREPADVGSKIVPYVQNTVQLRVSAAEKAMMQEVGWAFLYILKGRQSGISTDQQAKNLKRIWSRAHTDVMTLADNQTNTNKIFQITRRALKYFPPPLLPAMGGGDTYQVSFTKRDSNFWTGTAGAGTAGRGGTYARFHGSEYAWWTHPRATLAAACPGLEGIPGAEVILETTPSTHGSEAHEFWRDTVKGKTQFRSEFLPWWLCDPPRYRIGLKAPDELGQLSDHERFLIAQHGLDLEQIKWRRAKIEFYGMGEFLKEYPEDDEGCWLVAGDLFYNLETLLALAQRTPRPVAYIPRGETEPRSWVVDRAAQASRDGEVWIYGEPAPTDRGLILGADTAEGVGGDGSSFVIRAFPSWRLIEEYISSTVEPKPFAGVLDSRSRRRSVFMVIEKNMHGITVLRELRDAGYPRKMLYHRPVLDDRNPEERSDRLGWATTAQSAPVLLDAGRDLFHEAREGRVPCPSADVIRDAFAVQRDKNGAVSLTGRDLLVAELLAWMGRTAPRG